MRIFKVRRFAKEAETAGLTDEALKEAIKEVQLGLVDANLGGNLIKKRVAVGSKGKSGGLRIIIVYKTSAENLFCLYVFAKNQLDNISDEELKALKKIGKLYLEMTAKQIKEAVAAKIFLEVK